MWLFMKTVVQLSVIIVSIILGCTSCRDDQHGAVYKIIIEQSGEYTAYKKYLILIASGGLFDEINQKYIYTPIIEDKHFEADRICLVTCEKIDLFMATLSIDRKKTNIREGFTTKLTLLKDNEIIREDTIVYTPEMEYPRTFRIDAAPHESISYTP